MVAANPDTELGALERLITTKAIVLTEEQKVKLAPIIRDLAGPEQNPARTEVLKEKLWATLAPAQVKAVKNWQTQAEKEAGALVETGEATATDLLSKYTGISAERLQQTIDGLTGLLQLKGAPEGSAEKLLQEVEKTN